MNKAQLQHLYNGISADLGAWAARFGIRGGVIKAQGVKDEPGRLPGFRDSDRGVSYYRNGDTIVVHQLLPDGQNEVVFKIRYGELTDLGVILHDGISSTA